MQIPRICQPETNLARVSRPDEQTLRDPLRSESLNGEQVLRSTGFGNGEIAVKQEEVTPTSPNIQEGWRNSSQVVRNGSTTTCSAKPDRSENGRREQVL